MPSTIPYDPSLVLANVVHPDRIANISKMSDIQSKADAAQEHLNALLASKRSLDMTKSELQNLGVPTTALESKMEGLDKAIGDAAGQYCEKKLEVEDELVGYREKIRMVNYEAESPVDFVKTEIKTMPLSADSLNMDVQYFSVDINEQRSDSHASAVSTFISSSLSYLGNDVSSQMSKAAQSQVSSQTSKHSLAGTLVFSVSCTHKNASILAPFVINVDKGIKVWNDLFGKDDQIKPESSDNMLAIARASQQDSGQKEKEFSIISGMTYGSSFVGMVHILNVSESTSSESLSSFAASLQSQMDAGAWFEKASGGFGVNTSFSNDVKNLLSSQNISSHVTLISMGVIPSIVASQVKLGVEKFTDFDPQKSMAAIATIQNATAADQDAVKSAADSARTGKQMQSMKSSEIKSALSALGEIDDGANKVLDINSLMTALEDYLKKAADGKSGVPINYYLKSITKNMLAEMWVSKYYPGKYLSIKADDSTDNSNNNNNAS
ncbi:hypothetical protein JDV02_003450 [Purpureocillium takamizusanense]|uniref:Uncharacterized protein n=1 Tax=Purpureocillium takamizusanense TaxID=2060973 RepID=A0A9Q8QDT3_9HYPO|nr:uncharacterized protein JDV02_003450 [Purpureocillium takamizusanense]UNI17071.1 hypothetical protein JDV02_003450 [Purpureocillium takamizusanense]